MTIINTERLKNGKQTGPLDDQAQDEIMRQAAAEIEADEAAKAGQAPQNKDERKDDTPPAKKADEKQPTAEELEAKRKADEAAAAAAKPKTEDEKTAEKAAEQKKADEAILLKKDEDLTPEEKNRKVEIQKAHEAEFDAEVKEYAAKEKISEEEARKDLESEKKLVEKYKAEPKKMARTILSTQRAYTKLQQDIKAREEQAKNAIGENEIVIKGQKLSFDDARDQMVEIYRDSHPKETEQLDDDSVFEKAKESWKSTVKKHVEAQKAKIGETAKAKRAELLGALPESAKPYKAQIEETLNNAPDERVLQDDYELSDIVQWARGGYLSDEKLKELEDAAFKRGQEKARILGEQTGGGRGAGQGSGQQQKPTSTTIDEDVASLTDDQKARAISMWQGIDSSVWDDNRKYKEYVNHLKESGEWKPAAKK